MALIDEGKLQGNIISILELLRKEAVCCPKIAAEFYCVDGTIQWVVIAQDGTVSVYSSPNGNPVPVWTTITPLVNGVCPI